MRSWPTAGGPTSSTPGGEFKNFELSAEVMTRPQPTRGSSSTRDFRTTAGRPKGFQVGDQQHGADRREGSEPQKTGSLFSVRHVYKQFVKDDEWFTLLGGAGQQRPGTAERHTARGLPGAGAAAAGGGAANGRVLGRGTFALQCHDPGSKALFRNLRVRRLPDSISSATMAAPEADGVRAADPAT